MCCLLCGLCYFLLFVVRRCLLYVVRCLCPRLLRVVFLVLCVWCLEFVFGVCFW